MADITTSPNRLTPQQVFAIANQRMYETTSTPDEISVAVAKLANSYVAHHQQHKQRIQKLDDLIDQKWDVIWPDQTVTSAAPKIANLVRTDLEDCGKLAGGADPTVLVDPDSGSEEDQEDAFMRQAILATYRNRSRYRITRRLLAMDLAGAGVACVVAWPDYAGGDIAHSFPRYVRKDPRHIYPDPSWAAGDEISNLVVVYRVKARDLDQAYPGVVDAMFPTAYAKASAPNELDVAEYYDSNEIIKVCSATFQLTNRNTGRKEDTMTAVTLARVPNLLGCPFAVIGVRPSFDGQFRGQFDDSIEPLGTANTMLQMHMDNMADIVYSERQVHGMWDNPEDFGPGATLYTKDPNARIERTPPSMSSPQMFTDVQMLLDMARLSSGVPASRYGDIRQSIASASFVPASQGHLSTEVEDYQEILADMEERVNRLALAIDEKYLSEDSQGNPVIKPIAGMAGGVRFSTTYNPGTAIRGRYESRVVYGEGSTLDSLNRQVAVLQLRNAGLMSDRRARTETLQGDVEAEERQIAKETMDKAFLQGLLLPETPLTLRAQVWQALDQGLDLPEIVDMVVQAQEAAAQAAQEQAQQQQAAMAAGQNATPEQLQSQQLSLQKGGQPGSADQLKQYIQGTTISRQIGGNQLPPLTQVMVGGG